MYPLCTFFCLCFCILPVFLPSYCSLTIDLLLWNLNRKRHYKPTTLEVDINRYWFAKYLVKKVITYSLDKLIVRFRTHWCTVGISSMAQLPNSFERSFRYLLVKFGSLEECLQGTTSQTFLISFTLFGAVMTKYPSHLLAGVKNMLLVTHPFHFSSFNRMSTLFTLIPALQFRYWHLFIRDEMKDWWKLLMLHSKFHH